MTDRRRPKAQLIVAEFIRRTLAPETAVTETWQDHADRMVAKLKRDNPRAIVAGFRRRAA